jgi:hypothetical protein
MMKGILKRLCPTLGLGLVVVTGLMSSAAQSKGNSPAASALFPAVSCSVVESLNGSREYFETHFSFIRVQGLFPWPDLDGRFDINGIWINSVRGTYAVVKQIEHASSPRHGALSVQFFSACNHKLLAEGTRILSARDWNTPEISVSFKNHALKGSRLRAYIRVILSPEHVSNSTLEVQIREARYGARDHFFMGRFE